MDGRDAAGIDDPLLRESYARCRALLAEHGRTYHLATLLLPPERRPYVQALYGYARATDDLVDETQGSTVPQRAARLQRWREATLDELAQGRSTHPVRAALVDTVRRWRLPTALLEAFLDAMAMDLTVSSYATYADLDRYVYGSAAVIGLAMLPVLGAHDARARDHAMDLGVAFQLANFVRDVGEDLDRGRVYLPLDELAAFGVTRTDLESRVVTPQLRAALAFQCERVRRLTDAARPGVGMLDPVARPCVAAALELYSGIVDAVEGIDYQVFDRRARVGTPRRLAVAAPAWLAARRARLQEHPAEPLGHYAVSDSESPRQARSGHGEPPDRATERREVPGGRPSPHGPSDSGLRRAGTCLVFPAAAVPVSFESGRRAGRRWSADRRRGPRRRWRC